ncbi:hypothetical protein [Sulfurimonas sp. HSL3-7]|uniref:hypothetical protein n=1 Tax=Sulfonitrofixus jiaomeiensis TaxID=3131938 RepID=UPI0031F9315B
MYRRILIATVLVSTLVAGSAMACSQGGNASCGEGKQSHGMKGQGQHGEGKRHFVRKVIAAVSKSGINSEQAEKVTDAINAFKQEKMEIMMVRSMPLDAFKGNAFDKKVFREIMLSTPEAIINAKAKLFEDIYAILDKEQRKVFTREFTAHMVEKKIKENMIKGHMLPNKGRGGSCR